jgi:hypothetical protein
MRLSAPIVSRAQGARLKAQGVRGKGQGERSQKIGGRRPISDPRPLRLERVPRRRKDPTAPAKRDD